MGRTKRNSAPKTSLKPKDVSDTEEYADAVDPNASEFIYDHVDEYFENQEREGAEKLARLMRRPKTFDENEVLGVASSSEDEEVTRRGKRKKKKKVLEEAEPLPPLDSDLEEGKEDEDGEGLTDEWGKKRSAYYSADYVDEEWDDANESDAEVAQLEEQEALAIQQQMAQQLEEADFGLDFITHLKKAEKVKESKPVEEEKIEVNLSQLSKREKLKLLNEESPELIELAEDFRLQMAELKETVKPLLKLVLDGVLPPSPGSEYIKARYSLIMNYCTQIGYYFVLKSKRASVQNHPVIKRLVQFRSLLHQIETVGSKLQPEIDDLLAKIKAKKQISRDEYFVAVAPPKKKLRILNQSKPKSETKMERKKSEKPSKKDVKSTVLTKDEEGAIQFYKAVRKQKDSDDEISGQEETPSNDAAAATSNVTEDGEEIGKRGINYQIAKNKGLTPHRPKEQRNPRVKHRMKFKKAKIRRKGAIREPRKELQRYAGENSGIKATVVRSVKLK